MFRPVQLELENFLSHQKSVYEFKQGKALLVIGENLDNEGQKGNGSGKSALNEAVSLAITGNTIRKAQTRELVRNGEEFCRVKLTLYDTVKNEDFSVERVVYSDKNKSSSCKIVINNNEVTDIPDINSYNKYVLERIGISKEDFFNFYLVTKEQYQPFFAIGDSRKKAIINHFSKADKIDAVFEHIEKDIAEIDVKINKIQHELTAISTKIGLKSDEIEQEKTRDYEGEREKRITAVKEKMQVEELSKTTLKRRINEEQNSLKEKESEVENFDITKYDDKIKLQQITCKEADELVEKLRGDYKRIESKYEERKKECSNNLRECKDLLVTLNKDLGKSIIDRDHLQQQLDGLIECPNCNYKFDIGSGSTDEELKTGIKEMSVKIKELESTIKETNELIDVFNGEKNSIDEEMHKEQDKVSQDGNKAKQAAIEAGDVLIELKGRKAKLIDEKSKLKNEAEFHITQIANFNKQLEQKDELISSYKEQIQYIEKELVSKLPQLEEQLEGLVKEDIETKQRLAKQEDEKSEIVLWIQAFKRFKSYLANQSIKNITDYTNLFLESIGSNISIEVSGYRELSTGKLKEEISTRVFRDGFEAGSYGRFSAGERGRIDLCCILALQELINLSSPTGGLDLLICDEVLDSVDSFGLELIISSLQDLSKTIMIVSQNSINTFGEDTLVIQKEGGISTIM